MDQQQPPPQGGPQPPPEGGPQPPQQWQQQPPTQQGWTPPPQQPMGWGGPGYAAPPPRPLGVTLASLFMIVMGVLFLLGGAACAAGGAFIGGLGTQPPGELGEVPPGLFGAFAGIAFFAAIVALILGVLQIAAGAGGFGGRGWARWTGIILAIILAFFLILGGVSSLGARDGAGSAITSLVIGVLYALAAWAFIQAGSWFAWRR